MSKTDRAAAEKRRLSLIDAIFLTANRYFPLTALTKSPSTPRLAVMILGALGLTCGVALAGQPSNPNACKNCAVFNAAPTNLMLTGNFTFVFAKLYAPPPYSMVKSWSVHPLHDVPSNPRVILLTSTPGWSVIPMTGITTGIAPPFLDTASGDVPVMDWPLVDACANVEVWFPRKNMLAAPSANDPNASITFVITPPSGDAGDCGVWKYHYKGKEDVISQVP
jgi:hypothetical protein